MNREAEIEAFYTSWTWRRCRQAYADSKGGLCERCLAAGLIVPGTQVHHKTRLTAATVNDPAVALNWDNLELLCDDCHRQVHTGRRYRADWETGHIDL